MAASNQAKRLTESSDKGTLFIVNNANPFLDPYFTTTTNSTLAVKEFFSYASSRLSSASRAALAKISKTTMLNQMVMNHDLIVIKLLIATKEAMELGPEESLWIIDGVDGMLTTEEVQQMVDDGEIGPDTLAIKGDEDMRPLREWPDVEIPERKFPATTGLANSDPSELKALSQALGPEGETNAEEPVAQNPVHQFIYVSREAKPRWAPGVLKEITSTFDIRKDDVFKWVQTVQSGGTVVQGEYKAKDLMASGRVSAH